MLIHNRGKSNRGSKLNFIWAKIINSELHGVAQTTAVLTLYTARVLNIAQRSYTSIITKFNSLRFVTLGSFCNQRNIQTDGFAMIS